MKMTANRPQSTPPLGIYMNGWHNHHNHHPPPPAVSPTKHSSLQRNQGIMTRRMTAPEMQFRPPRMRDSYTAAQRRGNVYPLRTNSPIKAQNRISDSSLQYYYAHGQPPYLPTKSPETPSSPSHTSQGSYSGSQAGYSSAGLDMLWETQSADSYHSDNTQASGISEPTFKRPRPRNHPRPSSTIANQFPAGLMESGEVAQRRRSDQAILKRREAWHMEDEGELLDFGSWSRTVGYTDDGLMANRVHRHYPQTSPNQHTSPTGFTGYTSSSHYGNPQRRYEDKVASPEGSRSPSPYGGPNRRYEDRVVSPEGSRLSSPYGAPNRRYEGSVVLPEGTRSASPYGGQNRRYEVSGGMSRRYSYDNMTRVTSTERKSSSRRVVSNIDQRVASPVQRVGSPVQNMSPMSPAPHLPPSQAHALLQLEGHQVTEEELHLMNKQQKRVKMSRRNKTRSSPSLKMKLGLHTRDSNPKDASKSFLTLNPSEAQKRRISSPEGHIRVQMMQKYGVSPPEEGRSSPDELGVMSDSESSYHKSNRRSSKSGGGQVLHRLAKKLGKLNLKGSSSSSSGVGGGSSEATSKRRSRSSSVSNLDAIDGSGRLTQSMDNLSPTATEPNKVLLDSVRGYSTPSATPTGTPLGTPKMSRSWSKTKLNRRGSEPDLEGAFATLFRSGSKKNLAMDPSEILFESIEHGNEESLQQLLDANMVPELNATNEDDFTAVDLAVMLGHSSIAKMLLAKGAKDSAKFCRDPFNRFSRIATLLMESERELDSLKCELVTQNVGNYSNVKDLERRLRRWEWRAHLFRKMKTIYEHSDTPGPPLNVTLHVTSSRSLTVRWSEPEETNGATVTRYKIEWCRSEMFAPIVGEFVMTDLRNVEYAIPDLSKGEKYFVRVSAYNMKGFGQPQMAHPSSATPSSWHDVDRTQPRFEGSTDNIIAIASQLSMSLSSSPPISPTPFGSNPSVNSKKGTKKGISKLFGSGVKFHKSPKAGLYLASLVYSGDGKVVVTVDDHIPTVEVSDSHSSSVGSDFVWLAKVACTWDHVRGMCEISDNYTSSPAVQFRNKLLHAIVDLQTSLGMQDLGLLHPVPYKDAHGAIVFVIVNYLQDVRTLQGVSMKWATLPRLWKKRTQTNGNIGTMPVSDQIVLDAQDIIAHHTNSTRSLTKGLYLGYLKARSTMASMRVICSREHPNVLPHLKIRDNPNVSSDEWEWVRSLSSLSTTSQHHSTTNPSNQSLQRTLLPAIDTFLHNLRISREDAEKHQLYCHEVIELNENISLILLLPPHDHVCTPPGSTDHFEDLPDFTALPINTFEIMQLYTYQKAFMTKFSMVSARLDIELLTSQQRLREAFSKEEVTQAKQLQSELEGFQEKTDLSWKQMRWIEEALQKGRSSSSSESTTIIPIKSIRDNIKSTNGIKRVHPVHSVQIAGHSSGYLRVFPAYNTGLAKGTSVKLYITLMTTASEVIKLVVQQLEKARLEKSIPGRRLTEHDLADFFLTCISGNTEWPIENDFTPLQLQAQASRCRLFVKRWSEEQLRLDEQATSV